jgi:dienelactone hydrolase
MTDTGAATQRRHAWLAQLQRMLPPSPAWDAWLTQTGELPPDFATMPAIPDLPDVLPATIANADDWTAHRESLKDQFTHWFLGSCPPPPDNLQVDRVSEEKTPGATLRSLRLTFGPDHKASLAVELLIPPGPGPFPVLLTQQNHRDWALIALRRGYIGCVYAGADIQDDTGTFVDAWPEYDWSRLMRRAWAGSRCVDYLLTLPEVNAQQISITGHSRNGKTSLMAAAFDERIALVIGSSPGAGGSLPARLCSELEFGEGIEPITRVFPEWFHPRLRFFAGSEQYLPVDMHQLLALCAPRPCLLATALQDSCENTWVAETSYLEAQRVYRFLDAPDALRLQWRAGGHDTSPTIIEGYIDWCDTHFGRGDYAFPERLLYPHEVPAGTGSHDEPPGAVNQPGVYGIEPVSLATTLGRADPGNGIEKRQIVFGEYLNADLYLPDGLADSGNTAPAVLWLPPWPSAHGYRAAYRRGEEFYRTLARAGFVVCCFDHIGSGSRSEEAEGFVRRHPDWSLLGKMVRDARAALDLMATLPYVDHGQIRAVGYATGSLIGLHLAALDDRIAGLAAVAPPADPDRWLRRLNLASAGNLADLLGSGVPKLVISPMHDRETPLPDITRAVVRAQARGAMIEHLTPDTYNQFGLEMHALVIEWLHRTTA